MVKTIGFERFMTSECTKTLILAFTLYCIVSEHLYKLRLQAENKDHYVSIFCVSVPWEIVYCSFVIEKYI